MYHNRSSNNFIQILRIHHCQRNIQYIFPWSTFYLFGYHNRYRKPGEQPKEKYPNYIDHSNRWQSHSSSPSPQHSHRWSVLLFHLWQRLWLFLFRKMPGLFLEMITWPLLNVMEQFVPSSNCSRTFLTLLPASTSWSRVNRWHLVCCSLRKVSFVVRFAWKQPLRLNYFQTNEPVDFEQIRTSYQETELQLCINGKAFFPLL